MMCYAVESTHYMWYVHKLVYISFNGHIRLYDTVRLSTVTTEKNEF